MKKFCSKILVLSFVCMSLTACYTTEAARKNNHEEAARKVAHMEEEPVTRMSFVPVTGDDLAFDIVVDETQSEGAELNQILPASGVNFDATDGAS